MDTLRTFYPNMDRGVSYPEIRVFGVNQDINQKIEALDRCLELDHAYIGTDDREQAIDINRPARLYEAWLEDSAYNFGTAGYVRISRPRLGRVAVVSAALNARLTESGREHTSAALLFSSLLPHNKDTKVSFKAEHSKLQIEDIWGLDIVGSIRDTLVNRNQWLFSHSVR